MSNYFDKSNPLSNRYITPEKNENALSSRSYPSDFVPGYIDVIVCRDMDNHNHIGNKNLRRIISSRVVDFVLSGCKVYRSNVVSSILKQVYKNGGAFIKKDKETGLWRNAENYLARGKVFQQIRIATKQSYSKSNSNRISKLQRTKTEIMSYGKNKNVGSNALLPHNCNVTSNLQRRKAEIRTEITSNKDRNQNVEFNAHLRLQYVNDATSNFHGKKTESKRIRSDNNNRNVEFNALLPALSKWFKDRGFPYTMQIDKWLCGFGVTSIEHLKLVKPEEWESHLLCKDKQSKAQPNCLPYPTIIFRSFQVAIEELKKVKYDATHAVLNKNEDSYNKNENRPFVGSNKRKRVDEDRKRRNLEASMSENASLKEEITCLHSKIDYLSKDLLCDQKSLSTIIPKLRRKEKEYRKLKEETLALKAKCTSTNDDYSVTETVDPKEGKKNPRQTYPRLLSKIISQQENLGCMQNKITNTNLELRKLEKENANLKEEIAAFSEELSISGGKQGDKRRKLLDHPCLEDLFQNIVPQSRNSIEKKNHCDTENTAVVSLIEEVGLNPVIEIL